MKEQEKVSKQSTINDLISNNKQSSDSQIRAKQKQLDIQEEQKMKEGMEEEEEEIREYFDEMQKPVKEDPTLVRKKRYAEKMKTYKSVMADVQIRSIFRQIKNFSGSTPEEEETIIDVKHFVKRRSLEGISVCVFGTSLFSLYNRRYITRTGVGMGIVVGVLTGTLSGFLRSTQYALQRFESLGPEYYLGRIAVQEIQDYRMDLKRKKPL